MLEIFLWIVFFLLLFRFLLRLLFPRILKWYVSRFQKKFFDQNNPRENKKEGEITIDYQASSENTTTNHPIYDDKEAETIEFEEIKDEQVK